MLVKPPLRQRLPRRDYLLLPLLSLLTILVIFAVAEVAARLIWPAQENDVCAIFDQKEGFALRPNCVSHLKNAEGIWTTNRYNECGYRSETSCGPKPPGSKRIVILGSSVSQGMFIPYDQTFFASAAKRVEAACRKKIDVQNLGVPNSSPIFVYRRLNEALALNPDVVLFVLTPFDLEQRIDPRELAERNEPISQIVRAPVILKLGFFKKVENLVLESRAVLMVQHYLFSDEDTFLRLYLMYGDKADFLRTPLTPAWENRFANLDLIIGDMARRTRASGASLIVMPVPSRAEAALLSTQHPPSHIDAAAFGRRLESIAAKHDAGYIDLMETFRTIPKSENLFYVVDGHLTPDGQNVLARRLTDKLLDGSIPAFSKCSDEKNKS